MLGRSLHRPSSRHSSAQVLATLVFGNLMLGIAPPRFGMDQSACCSSFRISARWKPFCGRRQFLVGRVRFVTKLQDGQMVCSFLKTKCPFCPFCPFCPICPFCPFCPFFGHFINNGQKSLPGGGWNLGWERKSNFGF